MTDMTLLLARALARRLERERAPTLEQRVDRLFEELQASLSGITERAIGKLDELKKEFQPKPVVNKHAEGNEWRAKQLDQIAYMRGLQNDFERMGLYPSLSDMMNTKPGGLVRLYPWSVLDGIGGAVWGLQ